MKGVIDKLENDGNELSKAMEWWNNLSGENKIIRLVAYKQNFGIDINYPSEEQVVTLYNLEQNFNP